MGILAVHITTAKIREKPVNEASLGHLGHPGQIGVGWVPQNDVTMEAVRADDYFPLPPVCASPPLSASFPRNLVEIPAGSTAIRIQNSRPNSRLRRPMLPTVTTVSARPSNFEISTEFKYARSI